MPLTPIHQIQGPGLLSPLANHDVVVRGVVIGATRKGFFIQDPDGSPVDGASCGVFVFRRKGKPPIGAVVEVTGRVVDYLSDDFGRPSTQVAADSVEVVEPYGPEIEPVWLNAGNVLVEPEKLAAFLNSLEGMLVGVKAGAVFAAPSNPFGDYVLLPADADVKRTAHGGVLIDPLAPERWLPGFRLLDYDRAPQVNVGSKLLNDVTGPLNFRVESFQIAARGPVRVKRAEVSTTSTTLTDDASHMTVLTLNGFNLDPHVESANLVKDPRRDIDDDVGDLRFDALGRAVAVEAGAPSIVALQEIQDEDGAEMTDVVSARRTYERLIDAIVHSGGPRYEWLEIPPGLDADGGQPGGNIRNAFLFDPLRVSYVQGTLQRLGVDAPAFDGSRKPLAARFRPVDGPGELEVINVHMASKRHQHGLFAPAEPGVDPRLELRIEQAELVGGHLTRLRARDVDYYMTGDFNDFEFSATLDALTGDHSVNLVDGVPEDLRYDYNHRGISQALMHGVVARRQLDGRTAEYEILHANALTGSRPGHQGDKASDHAYVIARLQLV